MQVSKFLRKSSVGYIHYCPACEGAHHYRTDSQGKANWTFNGNTEKPSFTPSMKISWGNKVPGYENWKDDEHDNGICHYFLTDGQLQFCSDSTHDLKGQTVPLPELPDWMAGEGYGDGNP